MARTIVDIHVYAGATTLSMEPVEPLTLNFRVCCNSPQQVCVCMYIRAHVCNYCEDVCVAIHKFVSEL